MSTLPVTLIHIDFDSRDIAAKIDKPNGFKKYKLALEMYRNFGSNANVDFASYLYYGLFTLVEDKHFLDERGRLSELIEVEKLHSEAFFGDPINLKKKYVNALFDFE